ncbi:hypothetical protein Dsin_006850 [Dipteronia sinensis]|uniref:hAT-like transposase RNase-H fold domain-containing protein n=1 Tax=Dipteronia sinensis TaxID=43782 RepID=A0AAE0EFZ1_9ROSI|nr:hypothetical protein Dsin_006850 [Dipteronia sinensis]
MLNDDFDLSGPAETMAGPSDSGATPTSQTYEITHRILSITLDNALANTSSISLFAERKIPQDGGYYFHQRCTCHIINLVVQSGLKEVSNRIDRIRDVISWISNSNPRLQEFDIHCTLNDLQPRRFQTDMPVMWNSIYLMLQNCLDYDTTISGFYNMKMAEIGRPQAQALTQDDWNNNMLGTAVVAMETKFKKYWSKLHFLYALGVIVDHMVKLSGLEFLLEFIGTNLTVDYSDQITDIRNKLFEVFSIYERIFGSIDMQPSAEADTQPLQTSWSILKRRKKDKSTCSSSSS